MELASREGLSWPEQEYAGAEVVEFTAETRMSGLTLASGLSVRKGAVDSVRRAVAAAGGRIPGDLEELAARIAKSGGTPLAVSAGGRILGLIHLKDTVKPGLKERFAELREMGIKTIMCTGDIRSQRLRSLWKPALTIISPRRSRRTRSPLFARSSWRASSSR